MLDEQPLHGAGQDLLAAYRARTGPSPEAIERLAAALERDIAATATAESRASGQANIIDLAARTRRRWTLGLTMLAVAAGLAMLALRPSLTHQLVQREDPAAAFHAEPGAAGSANARAPTRAPEPPAPPPAAAPEPRPAELARPRLTPAAPAPEPAREPSLAEELEHMRPAQLALGAGDPVRALALLEVYARSFPAGRLHEEYQALRAIALCEAGQAPAGRAEASEFLAARPRSIFAERVRGACD